jgi:serine/threonine-protein kinase RsbW
MRWPVDVRFALDLPRETYSIPVIRRVMGDTLRGLGVSESCIADLLVAISEACTNAVQHAGSGLRYSVTFAISAGQCVVKIVDRGRGFDRPSEKGADADSESGRGIKIMKSLVDDVGFDVDPESGTVVYLQKHLTWREGAPIRVMPPELLKTAG